MTKRIRPIGFVKADDVMLVIERSINSAVEWYESTGNEYFNPAKRVKLLHELMDVVIELKWRYGNNNVHFKFTKNLDIPNTVKVSEMISTYWQDKVLVQESKHGARVYINF